jgi:hypothetical protein
MVVWIILLFVEILRGLRMTKEGKNLIVPRSSRYGNLVGGFN